MLNTDNDASRRVVESCYRTTSTLVNPIIDWTDDEVWEFLHHYGCNSNPLYAQGYDRIGCIGCPMAGAHKQKRELNAYPVYKNNYIKAFDRMIAKRKEKGLEVRQEWATGEKVMRWWVGDNPMQITIEDYFGGLDEENDY